MKNIMLGYDANGRPLYLTPEMRRETHMHVIGGSGLGKSKCLEQVIRQDILAGHGICLVDWHGPLYKSVLDWCAYHHIGLNGDRRSLILIDPTQDDFVMPLNFFTRRGLDVSTQVSRRIAATVRVWGQTSTDGTPTLERICTQLFTFAVEHNESLVNAAHLLDFHRPELRDLAINKTADSRIRSQWTALQQIKTLREWTDQTMSTENRLNRFLGSRTVKRFLGLTDRCLSIREAMDRGAIVLVNLGDTDFLSRDQARLFGALLLNEFFEAAMQRANALEAGERARPFSLTLDEFQEYVTHDLAAMLDQVRKGGLQMTLAHQHLGHFVDDPRLAKSVTTNVRIRVVFGGLGYDDACIMANEMFLPDLNQRQIKKAIFHTTHTFEEQTRTVRSSSTSRSRGTGRGNGSTWSSGAGSGSGSGRGQASGTVSPVEGWFDAPDTTRITTTSSDFTSSSDFSTRSDGGSRNESEFESDGEGCGETVVPVWVPIPKRELMSESEWTREEKLSKVAELLVGQMPRHCYIKLNREKTQPLMVPFIRERLLRPERLLQYVQAANRQQGALLGSDVDRLLIQREQEFLEQARSLLPLQTEIRPGREVPLKRRTRHGQQQT